MSTPVYLIYMNRNPMPFSLWIMNVCFRFTFVLSAMGGSPSDHPANKGLAGLCINLDVIPTVAKLLVYISDPTLHQAVHAFAQR